MANDYRGLVPYLFYDDVETAMAWYERVFGFDTLSRWNNDDGKLQNAEMRVGNTELWLDGGGKQKLADDERRPTWIGVCLDDVDAIYRRVLDAGIDVEAPVDRDFGVRMLTVPDREGYLWGFMRRAG